MSTDIIQERKKVGGVGGGNLDLAVPLSKKEARRRSLAAYIPTVATRCVTYTHIHTPVHTHTHTRTHTRARAHTHIQIEHRIYV